MSMNPGSPMPFEIVDSPVAERAAGWVLRLLALGLLLMGAVLVVVGILKALAMLVIGLAVVAGGAWFLKRSWSHRHRT